MNFIRLLHMLLSHKGGRFCHCKKDCYECKNLSLVGYAHVLPRRYRNAR